MTLVLDLSNTPAHKLTVRVMAEIAPHLKDDVEAHRAVYDVIHRNVLAYGLVAALEQRAARTKEEA